MSRKTLQLHRNHNISDCDSYEKAVQGITTYLLTDSGATDGEIASCRYIITSETEPTIIKTVLGALAINETIKSVTIFEDVDALKKKVLANGTACATAFKTLQNTIGLTDNLTYEFDSEDENLKDCTSITNAIETLSAIIQDMKKKYVEHGEF